MENFLSWVLALEIKAADMKAFNALIDEMVAATKRNEPDTINYEYFVDGEAVHIFERYKDAAAAMVHFRTFGNEFAERFFGLAKPTGLTVYGPPSDELRAALASFNPTFTSVFKGFAR